jgi:hypothetical protein
MPYATGLDPLRPMFGSPQPLIVRASLQLHFAPWREASVRDGSRADTPGYVMAQKVTRRAISHERIPIASIDLFANVHGDRLVGRWTLRLTLASLLHQ